MSITDYIFMIGVVFMLVAFLVGIILLQSWGLLLIWFATLAMAIGTWSIMRLGENTQ